MAARLSRPRRRPRFGLETPSFFPPFDNASYRRRLAHAAKLSGPERYLTYGALATELARSAAPMVVWGNGSYTELFSARVGCQIATAYLVDLAALCIRKEPA